MRKVLSFLFLFSSFFPVFVQAQEAAPPEAPTPAPVVNSLSLLDLSDSADVMDAANALIPEAKSLVKRLQNFEKTEVAYKNLAALLEHFNQIYELRRELSSWGLNKAIALRADSQKTVSLLNEIKADHQKKLGDADEKMTELRESRSAIKGYLSGLAKAELSVGEVRGPLLETLKSVEEMIAAVKGAKNARLKLHYDNADLRRDVNDFQKDLDASIEEFRKNRFAKTAPAFYEADFYKVMTRQNWQEFKQTLRAVIQLDQGSIKEGWPVYLMAVFGFLILWLLLVRLVPDLNLPGLEATPRYEAFLIASCFSLTVAALFFEQPPVVVAILFWLLAAQLIFMVLRHLEKRADGKRLSRAWPIFAYAAYQSVLIVGLPHAVYRVLLLALAGGFVFSTALVLKRKPSAGHTEWAGKRPLYSVLLGFSFISVGALLLGYASFAEILINGTLRTIFVFWVLRYTALFATSLLESIFSALVQKRIPWFGTRGVALAKIVKGISYVFLVLVGLAALDAIWTGEPLFQAIREVLHLGVTIGAHTVYMHHLLAAFLAIAFVQAFIIVVCTILDEKIYARNNVSYGTGQAVNKIILYTGWFVAGVWTFNLLGFKLEQFALIAGALSVGIGFGLQNIVNNFVSGLILLFERPIKMGDLIDVNGQWGRVEKVGLRSTVIRGNSKAQFIIPNSNLILQTVANLTLSDPEFRVLIPLSFAYGTNVKELQTLVNATCLRSPKILADPTPRLNFTGFGDNGLQFELWVWIAHVEDRFAATSELLSALNDEFQSHGISVPFPQRDLHVRWPEGKKS